MASPPTTHIPVALASITRPGIRLAGELADRWLPFLLPQQALDHGRELLAQGARSRPHAGTDGDRSRSGRHRSGRAERVPDCRPLAHHLLRAHGAGLPESPEGVGLRD